MTYQELCSFGTLWTAYHRARRCKRGKKSTAPFEYSAIEELLILSKSLLQGTHQPDPLDAFYIYEPKKRLIQAPTFRDKVVQHALTDYIVYDELARSFTLNTYAAQYGKGTHYGLEMLKRHMRTYFLRRKGADEVARKAAGLPHRPMEEWDYAEGWVIKGDIRHFFQSIDHQRLKAALEPRFPDPDIRALMWRYIDAVDEGLALGHQTSHIYAVFYVSSFMHYVGEKLHLPLAGMYMDDWYVICPDKATAVEALRLARLEFAKLGLELNDKTNIFPLAKRHRLLRLPHLSDPDGPGGQQAALLLHQADETTHPAVGEAVRSGRGIARENHGELYRLGGTRQTWRHKAAPQRNAVQVVDGSGPRRRGQAGGGHPRCPART